MSIVQLLLIAVGLMAVMVLGYAVLSGPSPAKEGARRLKAVRYRHSDSHEGQGRSADAQGRRRAQAQDALRSPARNRGLERADPAAARTGKPWTVTQYLYASLGLMLGVTVLLYISTGAALLALVVGVAVGAGLPHLAVGFLIKRRANAFTVKFPDAIELLVRGLRSGLPVTETLGVVATEVPGPVGEEFKMITERIKIGRTMEDALQETADRLNMPEFNFFVHHASHPARDRRQPGRNPGQPRRRAAQALADEAQDQGDELRIRRPPPISSVRCRSSCSP